MKKEARLYKKINENLRCEVCPRYCVIPKGSKGFCKTRIHEDGKLYTLIYAEVSSLNIDPIEKKPLFHFLPGTKSFSIGTISCNLQCKYCITPDSVISIDGSLIQISDFFDNACDKEEIGECHLRSPAGRVVTLSGSEAKAIHVSKREYKGEMFKIKPYYTPGLSCTPEHEIFVFSEGKIVKKRADKINLKDYLIVPKEIGYKIIFDIDVKKILEEKDLWKSRWIRKINLQKSKEILAMKNEGFTSRQIGLKFNLHPTYVRKFLSIVKKEGVEALFEKKKKIFLENNGKIRIEREKSDGIPRYVKVDEDLGKLFGYYCAEGSVVHCSNRPASFCLKFSFGKSEMNLVDEVAGLIESAFGIKASIHERTTTLDVCVGSSSIALFFDISAGNGAKNKIVPAFITNSEKKVIRAFLKAYIKGDGWISKEIISTNTVSKTLALDIFWLFLKIGCLPQFYEWRPPEKKMIGKRIVNQSTLYYVKTRLLRFGENLLDLEKGSLKKSAVKFKENKNYYFIPVFSIKKENYNGPVFNLEINPSHSYLANFVAISNCQNWDISHRDTGEIATQEITPENAVKMAKEYGCKSISYTYNEPAIWFEFVYDTAKLAHEQGLKNVLKTNGYISKEALKELLPFIDAVSIDLKSVRKDFYQKLCNSNLSYEPAIETAKELIKNKKHVEIVNLVIPGWNNTDEDFKKLSKLVLKELGQVPVHFTAFHPSHKLTDVPSTSVKTLEKAREIALKEGLKFVYVGNVPGHEYENTYCPKCGNLLIKRNGFDVMKINLKDGKCPKCNTKVPIML
jgi:pyruvate formate lyase activating enzyme